MAKCFYWLKLKDDFFNEKYVKILRKMAGGETFVIIYLKMQLISLKTEGIINYEHILPSFEDELALALDEDNLAVKQLVAILLQMGIVELWENNTLYMKAMQEMIGKEGSSAERVRKHRETQKLLSAPKNENKPKTDAERAKAYRVKKECSAVQHVPLVEDYNNKTRYSGNYYHVMKRDGYKCSICSSIENLCVHHVDGYDEEKPENNEQEKMLVLCRHCHSNIHAGKEIPKNILYKMGYYDNCHEHHEISNTSVTSGNVTVTKSNTEKEKEKEKEKDLEIENKDIGINAAKAAILPITTNTKKLTEKKKNYGEFENVKLTEEEYSKLIERFGKTVAEDKIENISLYMSSKGDKYKSHYATILSWSKKDTKDNVQFNKMASIHSATKLTKEDEAALDKLGW